MSWHLRTSLEYESEPLVLPLNRRYEWSPSVKVMLRVKVTYEKAKQLFSALVIKGLGGCGKHICEATDQCRRFRMDKPQGQGRERLNTFAYRSTILRINVIVKHVPIRAPRRFDLLVQLRKFRGYCLKSCHDLWASFVHTTAGMSHANRCPPCGAPIGISRSLGSRRDTDALPLLNELVRREPRLPPTRHPGRSRRASGGNVTLEASGHR